MVASWIVDLVKAVLLVAGNWTSYGTDDAGTAVVQPGWIKTGDDEMELKMYAQSTAILLKNETFTVPEVSNQSDRMHYMIPFYVQATTPVATQSLYQAMKRILRKAGVTGYMIRAIGGRMELNYVNKHPRIEGLVELSNYVNY